tara:strand:- start:5182 stop:5589 length:408 start_codon:yes stop_codon:yes gene_type:complete
MRVAFVTLFINLLNIEIMANGIIKFPFGSAKPLPNDQPAFLNLCVDDVYAVDYVSTTTMDLYYGVEDNAGSYLKLTLTYAAAEVTEADAIKLNAAIAEASQQPAGSVLFELNSDTGAATSHLSATAPYTIGTGTI